MASGNLGKARSKAFKASRGKVSVSSAPLDQLNNESRMKKRSWFSSLRRSLMRGRMSQGLVKIGSSSSVESPLSPRRRKSSTTTQHHFHKVVSKVVT
ncbi:hypothetical protein PVL29_008178 [Vitis rotundifolia]|uniref:Uncharacterized protein n=1 Tax=Vitis rotundifolia TaxID=103349 RepID=A0AA39A415_VITRO|nr:hypothetical protein PVL29_008178 [Vitis rotundifolia]